MKRIFRELRHDLREPGLNIAALPVVSVLFLLLSCVVQARLQQNDNITLGLLEVLIPFLGGYASLMLMQGLLDTESGDLLFTYSRSNLYWGIIRQLRLFAVQVIHATIVCICVACIIHITPLEILLVTLLQSFAVMAVAFCGVAATRSVRMGLIILLAFIGIQITLGREFAIFNWLYILSGNVPTLEDMVGIALRALPTGFVYGFPGQLWVRS